MKELVTLDIFKDERVYFPKYSFVNDIDDEVLLRWCLSFSSPKHQGSMQFFIAGIIAKNNCSPKKIFRDHVEQGLGITLNKV